MPIPVYDVGNPERIDEIAKNPEFQNFVNTMFKMAIFIASNGRIGPYYWAEKDTEDGAEDESGECRVGDLDPLHSPETVGNRPDIEGLSDEELLDAVNNPKYGDPLRVNTETGKLHDGNTRAHELIRRSKDPNSSISPDTRVKVVPHTPDRSMFHF